MQKNLKIIIHILIIFGYITKLSQRYKIFYKIIYLTILILLN